MTPEQQQELLKQIQADRKAFGVLFDHYYRPIFGYLYRRVGQYDLAKDMTAETFLKAFLKIDRFVWREIPLASWLYRIATNEANQFFRKRRYKADNLDSILDAELPRQPDSEEERLALEAEVRQLVDFQKAQACLNQIDIRYQEVIALRYFEQKNVPEIAQILGKPEGTIKSLISRGLDHLRKRMTS